mmetsp:Transcript_12862/g.32940  ORF Transcript_12862/g.32940 Transcript_12862/m.32940 type:complete len:239 (+) Transcript_12862:588-1304(+)
MMRASFFLPLAFGCGQRFSLGEVRAVRYTKDAESALWASISSSSSTTFFCRLCLRFFWGFSGVFFAAVGSAAFLSALSAVVSLPLGSSSFPKSSLSGLVAAGAGSPSVSASSPAAAVGSASSPIASVESGTQNLSIRRSYSLTDSPILVRVMWRDECSMSDRGTEMRILGANIVVEASFQGTVSFRGEASQSALCTVSKSSRVTMPFSIWVPIAENVALSTGSSGSISTESIGARKKT